jgi:PEP-CTERM motif
MKADLRQLATLLCGVALAVLLSPSAHAAATLDAQIVNVTCTVTTSEGTLVLPCSAGSWVVALQPGWRALMTATIEYAYTDDGLALASIGGFQMDVAGFGTRLVDHEAGGLYAMTSNCISRYCSHPPGQDYFGASGFPPIFLSDNDVAESVNGLLTVSTGAELSPQSPFGWNPTVFIGLRSQTFAGLDPVTAVPEPSTLCLWLLSLAALAWTVRQRPRHALSR